MFAARILPVTIALPAAAVAVAYRDDRLNAQLGDVGTITQRTCG
ncbi:MAG TPA: hypothetical protein PKL49_08820 [Steroidobacteraceae bacterium]|nr:hypothetical protein [Steroidobacteraceae bacterium]HNS27841.1 hypothetical protein [Steroidobacteraceae bacterium]